MVTYFWASCKGFSKKKMVKKSYLGINLYGINAKMIEKKSPNLREKRKFENSEGITISGYGG